MFPFTQHGELFHSIQAIVTNTFKTLEEARFTGTLSYLTYLTGSKIYLFTDGVEIYRLPGHPWRSRLYRFTQGNFLKLLPRLNDGQITGTFIPCQRGTKYTWKLER
jgi:hypothetical protein